jgi:hypothetical protein
MLAEKGPRLDPIRPDSNALRGRAHREQQRSGGDDRQAEHDDRDSGAEALSGRQVDDACERRHEDHHYARIGT